MRGMRFSDLQSLLCLGAHSDDLEIGAGATVLKLVSEHPQIHITWVVFSARNERAIEAQNAAHRLLSGASAPNVILKEFPDSYFPQHWAAIKSVFEALKGDLNPDLVLTHNSADKHQDHRLIGELTWNTFRNHQILEYEIPKFDGDIGQPNFFVPVSTRDAEKKIGIISQSFPSQSEKDWFNDATFMSLMRLRGMECRSDSRLAEAFYTRKMIWESPSLSR